MDEIKTNTAVLALTESMKLVVNDLGWDAEMAGPLRFDYVDDRIFVEMSNFDCSPGEGTWVACMFGPDNRCVAVLADDDDLEELRNWQDELRTLRGY